MTPKEEREWAQGILERVEADSFAVSIRLLPYCLYHVRGLAENQRLCDKQLGRRLADMLEDIIWCWELQNGKITRAEFDQRFKDKATAEYEKKMAAYRKRLERDHRPRRNKRKKRTASGR